MVQHAQDVIGHVGEVVAAVDVLLAAEALREARVAVVEPDDGQALVREEGDELVVPADHLRPAAGDEHEDRVGLVTEHLVVDPDPIDVGVRHRRLLPSFSRV